MKRLILIVSVFSLFCGCTAHSQKSKSLVPTGLETSKAVGERTRDSQEKDATGSMYVTSEEKGADIEKAKTQQPPTPEVETASLKLVLASDGTVTRDGERLDEETLKSTLAELPDEAELSIHAAPDTAQARVVELLDEVRAAGITRVSVVMSPTETSEKKPKTEEATKPSKEDQEPADGKGEADK